MASPETDPAAGWTAPVARLSFGTGCLYALGYTAYVLTEWGPALLLPPVLFLGYLSARSAVADLWSCGQCGRTFVSGRCRACGAPVVDAGSAARLLALFVMIVPAGAVAVEVVFALGLGLAFEALGGLPPVAAYQRQWLDVVGYAGPLPLFVYTVGTTAGASVLALVSRTVRVGLVSGRPGDR